MKLGTMIFSARVIAVIIILWSIDFQKLAFILGSMDFDLIALAVLLELAGFLLWAAKWKFLVDRLEKIRFSTLFLGLMAGNCLDTNVLRARTMGGFGRVMFLKNITHDREHANWYATVVMDHTVNSFVFSIPVIFSLLFVFLFLDVPLWLSILMETMAIIVFLLALFAYLSRRKIKKTALAGFFYSIMAHIYDFKPLRFFRERFGSYNKFEESVVSGIAEFVKTSRLLLEDNRTLVTNLCLSAIMYAFIYTKAYVLFMSAGYDIPILHLIVSLTLTLWLSSILPFGFGFKEVLMIGIYAVVGVPVTSAAIVSILDRGIYLFFTVVVAYSAVILLRIFHIDGSKG